MRITIEITPATEWQREYIANTLMTTLAVSQGLFHGRHKKNKMTIDYEPEWKENRAKGKRG